VTRLTEQAQTRQQLGHLNTYLTVSSTLAQLLQLRDVLEITLYSCMEAVSAETASVLLLDDEGENFNFYHVEGPTKPILMTESFPADKGFAGSVLKSQQAEIINAVQDDPRFYQQVDSKSGFQTQNMIVVPLTAGEEQVGVLEVLNKIDEQNFLEDEKLLLVLIAEEIAYAIRNAKVFELVVKSYCKQLQGQTSCAGCNRPLRTWTPCVKYQEVEGIKL
jgi:adenylate cyclase